MSIPKINGIPKMSPTNFTISIGGTDTDLKIAEVGSYILPQKARFKGVITTAKSVAIAVKLTDNASLPLEK